VTTISWSQSLSALSHTKTEDSETFTPNPISMLHNIALHWVSNYKCRQYWSGFRKRSILFAKGEVLTVPVVLFVPALTSEGKHDDSVDKPLLSTTRDECQNFGSGVRGNGCRRSCEIVQTATGSVSAPSQPPLSPIWRAGHSTAGRNYCTCRWLPPPTALPSLQRWQRHQSAVSSRGKYNIRIIKTTQFWLQHPLAMRSQNRKSESLLCLSAHVTTRKDYKQISKEFYYLGVILQFVGKVRWRWWPQRTGASANVSSETHWTFTKAWTFRGCGEKPFYFDRVSLQALRWPKCEAVTVHFMKEHTGSEV